MHNGELAKKYQVYICKANVSHLDYSTKHEKTYGKCHRASREAILKKLKGNQARNQAIAPA